MSNKIKLNTRVITPEMAKKFLQMNTNNRPLSKRHVDVLAAAMERGEWQVTGESIKISEANTLLDGQHRLTAIVKAGVSVKMVVVEGLPVESFHVIDTGSKPRGTADVMAIGGEKNPLVFSAAARIVKNWEVDPDLTKNTTTWTVTQIEQVLERL